MIRINDLTFKYKEEIILNKLNLEINNGDFIAIIGANGSGKSTLLKCLMGINKVDHHQIEIDNECITCFKNYQAIGYVPQLKTKSLELAISGREYFNLITKSQIKINQVIIQLEIQDIVDKNINNLSGGQIQRINIAKALLNDIKYLVLDEPNTGLDVQTRLRLFKLLNKLNIQGLTIIIVSHHLGEIKEYTNKIFNIEQNKLVVGDEDA